MKEVLAQLLYAAGSAAITLFSAWFKKKNDLRDLKEGKKVINDELKIVDK